MMQISITIFFNQYEEERNRVDLWVILLEGKIKSLFLLVMYKRKVNKLKYFILHNKLSTRNTDSHAWSSIKSILGVS